MKKNQPSPSKVQNPEQDPAPSPSPSLNPEAAHTAPPPQSPPPSGSNELNAPPTSEEGQIYDSPSSSPRSIHSEENDDIYSSPPSPGNSSLNESVYDKPLSPPRPAQVQDTEQSAEDSTYETSPSNRPLSPKRESRHLIYDVPPAPAQPHARREHVYDVPSSSSRTPSSLEGELSATAEPTQTATKATVSPELPPRLKRSPVHEADQSVYAEIDDSIIYTTIPDLPQQGEKEQYTPLSPKKDPNSLYAALRPKSPVHSRSVEQSAASSQKRQSTGEVSPDLPPRPELLDVYEIPDAEQKTVDTTVRPKKVEQNATKAPQQMLRPKAFSPELPPRPGSVGQSTTKKGEDKSLYSAIGLRTPPRAENKAPSGVSKPEAEQNPESSYTNISSTEAPHSRGVEQSAANAQKRQSTQEKNFPPLPPRPEILDVYEASDDSFIYASIPDLPPFSDRQQNVASNQPIDPIYETISDLPQSSDGQQNVASNPELEPLVGLFQEMLSLGNGEIPSLESVYEVIQDLLPLSDGQQNVERIPELESIYKALRGQLQSSDGQQNVTPTPERESIYESIPDLPQHGARAQYTPPSSAKGSMYTKNIDSGLPLRPGSVEQSTTKQGEDKSMYTAIGLKIPPRVKNKVPSDVSKSEQKQTAKSDYTNTLPQRASHSKGVEKDTGLPRPPKNTRQGTEKVSQQNPKPKPFRPELPPRPGSAQQSASVSSTPSPTVPPKRFSYSKDGIPSDALDYGHVYATVAQKTFEHSSNRKQTTPKEEVDGIVFAFPRTSSDSSQSRSSLLTREVQEKILCEARKSEVQRCCRVVYGKEYLLDFQMKKIQKNSDFAENLSMQISSKPDRLHKLAGTNLCGLKSGRRKEAEAGIFHLVKAIEAYGSAVKSLKEIQTLSKMEVKPLSDYDVMCKVRRMPPVQEARQEIRLLCKEVFGNMNHLQCRMEEIERVPSMAEELTWQLQNHTRSFGKLAGHKFCGMKTNARKTAEQLLPDLCKAIRDYSDCVTQARESVLENHREKIHSHKLFMEDIRQLKGPQKENADLSKKTARVVSESSHPRVQPKKQAGALSL